MLRRATPVDEAEMMIQALLSADPVSTNPSRAGDTSSIPGHGLTFEHSIAPAD
jgi:hypothetical protein